MEPSTFKELFSPRSRSLEYTKISQKHPDRIPIILDRCQRCELPHVSKNKYLVTKELTMSQFLFTVRRRINLKPSQSLFILVNGQLVNGGSPLSTIYETHKDEDGFLYMVYTSENTFG
jgi:GABA(A) receptor-associated protein